MNTRQAQEAQQILDTLPSLAEEERWLGQLRAWQATLQASYPTSTHPTPREIGLAQNIDLSLKVITEGLQVFDGSTYSLTTLKLGELMIADGYVVTGTDPRISFLGTLPWFGTIDETVARIASVLRRREQLQAQIDDAMLADDVRRQRDIEITQRIAELNAKPQRKIRGDNSCYAKYPNGVIEELGSIEKHGGVVYLRHLDGHLEAITV